MKRYLIALLVVVCVSAGAVAGNLLRFTTTTGLYAKRGAICVQLANANQLTSKLQTGLTGTQGQIPDYATGNQFTLWEDAGCVNTPVYFQP